MATSMKAPTPQEIKRILLQTEVLRERKNAYNVFKIFPDVAMFVPRPNGTYSITKQSRVHIVNYFIAIAFETLFEIYGVLTPNPLPRFVYRIIDMNINKSLDVLSKIAPENVLTFLNTEPSPLKRKTYVEKEPTPYPEQQAKDITEDDGYSLPTTPSKASKPVQKSSEKDGKPVPQEQQIAELHRKSPDNLTSKGKPSERSDSKAESSTLKDIPPTVKSKALQSPIVHKKTSDRQTMPPPPMPSRSGKEKEAPSEKDFATRDVTSSPEVQAHIASTTATGKARSGHSRSISPVNIGEFAAIAETLDQEESPVLNEMNSQRIIEEHQRSRSRSDSVTRQPHIRKNSNTYNRDRSMSPSQMSITSTKTSSSSHRRKSSSKPVSSPSSKEKGQSLFSSLISSSSKDKKPPAKEKTKHSSSSSKHDKHTEPKPRSRQSSSSDECTCPPGSSEHEWTCPSNKR